MKGVTGALPPISLLRRMPVDLDITLLPYGVLICTSQGLVNANAVGFSTTRRETAIKVKWHEGCQQDARHRGENRTELTVVVIATAMPSPPTMLKWQVP